MISLYAIPVSTSCARTRIVLDHKNLDYKEIPPPDGYASVSYRDVIPAGTVPGLLVDDLALSDSNAQVELLEELHPSPAMMPEDPIGRAKVRSLASFHDTRIEPTVRALFPLVKPQPDQTSVQAAAKLFQDRLNLLSDVAEPAPYLGSDIFTHADAAYPTTLLMGLDILKALNVPISLDDKLNNWMQALNEIPAVTKSLTLNRAAVADWIASKLETNS